MTLRDLALVLIITLAWSFNLIAAAMSTQGFPPFLVMILRFLMVLAVLWPALKLPPKDQWPRVTAICLLGGGLHFTLLFMAMARSEDVSSIAVTIQAYIPMTVILAMAFLGERPGWRSLLGVTVAIAGVLVVGFDPLVLRQLDVLLLVLTAALTQAIGSILMRDVRGLTAFGFQAWTALISMPFMVLGTALFEHGHLQLIQQAEPGHWLAIAYSALGASIVGHGLFFFLVQRHPVSSIMPYLTIMPVFGVLLGILVWGDRPGWRLWAGGAMVITGVLAITLRARRNGRSRRAEPAI